MEKPNETIDELQNEFEVGGVPVKVVEIGSSGTELFSGYIFEEYLSDLQGKQAADIFDKMRRSDPKVKMILSAMKNPIKSATWEITERGETTREGEIQKAFIEHILFNDLNKTWKSFLHEALSCIDFGYSIFEITYSAVLNHETFGSYNGIRSLAFRSQRTIEKWNVNRHGELESVYQEAHGDSQNTVTIPEKYLLHFAIDKEGDNFEGISILRPAYGPWLRKNTFLKMMASGIEKYAIPIPMLEIPEGKQNSPEYKKAINAMRKYVSNQCNYLTVPFGWKMTLTTNTFDASKIREVIDKENVEIVNAALANFLELGQSGTGSYSLSFDLSDFFLGGLESVACQITETINMVLIPRLIKLNFPDSKILVELTASGIRDRAGEELAKVVDMLVKSGVIKADDRLEESLRNRFGLPEVDESTTRSAPTAPALGAKQFSEDKSVKKKSSDPVKAQIESDADQLKRLMQVELNEISTDIVEQSIKHWESSSDAERVAPPKEYKFKSDKYAEKLREELSRIYNDSVTQAKKENPFFRNIKLSETESRIKFAEVDKLSEKALIRINGIVDGLVEANTGDIKKTINLQYVQSAEKFSIASELSIELANAAEKTIAGPMTTTGSIINSSTMLNVGRFDFFKEMEKTGEVESYTWINIDPVSAICKGIVGTTLKVGDPGVDLYWPPLHHNCKTYITANTSKTSGNPKPQDGFNPTKTQSESITLADARPECCSC